MFNKAEELLRLCNEKNKRISEIVIEKEIKANKTSYEDLMDRMYNILRIMKDSSKAALDREIVSVSGLTGGDAKKLVDYNKSNETLTGSLIISAMAKALSTSEVNASMGKIVAAPTAGASGIIPSALLSAQEKLNLSDEQVIMGLFVAAGIGEIIAKNATVSGAEGGCQAECGSAAAMAAGAIVELAGGSPEASFHAASFALVNIMGLVCDPIGGLVEYPCALRNASGVVNGLISADLALAGVKSLVPFDEIVDTMYRVGKMMPEALRETALGGVATSPTGEEIKRRLSH
ncbi:MAG: L-serine ammonia-lyase, iron-sulfur-dependent, subunit alpha [Tissierellia bacterium]|nr:L-serine ammonia-lyase, iron-sulfur-dependent, subunit alpha [Tissierellia bacterium]